MIEIDMDTVKDLLSRSWKLKEIAESLKVGYSTLRRRLIEEGIEYRHHIHDDELREVIDAYGHPTENGRGFGHRPLQALLAREAGVRVPRAQILRVRSEDDPAGNAGRRERATRSSSRMDLPFMLGSMVAPILWSGHSWL